MKTVSIKLHGNSLIFALFILCLSFQNQSFAAEKEKDKGLNLEQILLMPGDVTLAHADLETKCESCHVHFDKDNQSPLCVDCHEVVQLETEEDSGFHGKLPKEQTNLCTDCHTDHKGRSFDITSLDTDLFDHDSTDFPIAGKHLGIECNTCHQHDKVTLPTNIKALPVDKAYRFEAFQCASCHEDFHQEELGDKCEDCHSDEGWSISTYDHGNTEFKLTGKHKDTVCKSCHVDNQFKKMSPQCKSCHLATDSHLGIMGEKCEDCHSVGEDTNLRLSDSTEQWLNSSFDHTKDTEYELEGKHQDVSCIGCHSKELKPASECEGCHLSADIHQGSNGNACQDCHQFDGWDKTEFTHETPLTGKHLETACDSCHTPGEKREKVINERSCNDCHAPIDPHLGELGESCENCHQTEDWEESVKFNHDFSSFPLTGSHQLLVCEACHDSTVFSEQSESCNSCHEDDDYHEQTLGDDCTSCHNTSVWTHWQFDHDQQTEYPLMGAHKNLQCSLCHDASLPEPLKPSTECISCHFDDDSHNGGFGMDCQQCHSEDKFDEINF